MALGKLWNAFFGKRSDTETVASATASNRTADGLAVQSGTSKPGAPNKATDSGSKSPVAGAPAARPILKVKRKALAAKAKKTAPLANLSIAAVDETPVVIKRILQPKKNAWSKHVAGRTITSILDTHVGNAQRAAELLEAIVCDSVPTPKYVAIDAFDLQAGGISVIEFHQRVRRVGGVAVPIPGSVAEGLRQLSRTLGKVDLVLIDGDKPEWQSAETLRLLARVTDSSTLFLTRDARNNWTTTKREVIAVTQESKSDQSPRNTARAA